LNISTGGAALWKGENSARVASPCVCPWFPSLPQLTEGRGEPGHSCQWPIRGR